MKRPAEVLVVIPPGTGSFCCRRRSTAFSRRITRRSDLDPEEVVRAAGGPIAVIDCFGVLDDAKIRGYLQLGCEVKGLGRGHIRRIKEEIKKERVSEGCRKRKREKTCSD